MSSLARFFLLLAGLLVGLWLRGGGDVFAQVGLPSLALLALLLAVATAPSPAGTDTRLQLGERYRAWLEAWSRRRATMEREQPATDEDLAAATRSLALTAPDRVLKALLTAERNGFANDAVAHLVIEMRRSLGHPSLSLRPSELERLLGEPATIAPVENAQTPQPTRTEPTRSEPGPGAPAAAPPNAPVSSEPVSFLS